MVAQSSLIVRNVGIFDIRSFTLRRTDILIRDRAIFRMEPDIDADADDTINGAGCIAIPGLINAHTHAHNNLTKSLADNWTLEDLRSWGLALFLNRTPEDQYLSAAIGAIEMLKTGCTAAYDQFVAVPTHTDEGVAAVVQAYRDVGMRVVLAPAVSDIVFYRAVPGLLEILPSDIRSEVERLRPSSAQALIRTTRTAIERWHGASEGRIRVSTAPVIPGECTEELMQGCLALVREFGVGLHTHVAETKIQDMAAERRWGHSIIAHLDETGVLGPHFVGGHCVWIDNEDIRRLADRGAMVAHNPASNLKLGSGIAPVREMLDANLILGIGSDGSMASDNQNIFEAMRIGALSSKVRFPHRPERWVGAQDVLRMATIDGAKVLGLGEEIGILEPGRRADLVLMQSDSPFLQPLHNAANALVYAETGTDVRTVIVDGRVVVRDGRITTVDESAIRSRAAEAAARLWRETASHRDLPRRIEPFLRSACAVCAAKTHRIDRYG
jgi:cytosine/adenosine deaminase-related metal-dependent hydrolase